MYIAGFERAVALLVDTIAPRHCACCDRPGAAICMGCLLALEARPQPGTRALEGSGTIHAAFAYRPPLDRAIAQIKYHDGRAALQLLAERAAGRMAAGPGPELILPVPLGSRRRRQRGYNQAELIARVWAAHWGRPVAMGLTRRRETTPQVGSDLAARAANVEGAFQWRGRSLAGAAVLVVDDVLTTGATLGAVASALSAAGAGRIDGAVLATVL